MRVDDLLARIRAGRCAVVVGRGADPPRLPIAALRLLEDAPDALALRRVWMTASPARERVGRLYREGTLLFLGCEADEVRLLDRLFSSYPPPEGPHLFVGEVPDGWGAEHATVAVGPELLSQLAAALAKESGAEIDDLDPEALLARVEDEADPAVRAKLLHQVARVFAAEPARALSALLVALREDPGGDVHEILRVAEQAGEDVFAQLLDIAREARDPGLWVRLGQICADRRRDHDAVAAFAEALALDRGRADALRGRAAIQRRQEKWGELDETLTALAELGGEPAAWIAVAELRETSLPQTGAAVAAYERALALDPEHVPALRALVRLYQRAGRGEDHLSALEKLAAAAPPVERPGLLRRLAAELDDERAAPIHERLLALEPRAPDAVRALERIWRAAGRWDALARLYDGVLVPDSPADLWHRAGETARALGDEAGAESRFARAVTRDAAHAPSLLALAHIAQGRGDLARAVTLILDAERRTPARQDRAALLWQAAELRGKLGDEPTELAARVLDQDPEHVGAGAIVAEAWVAAQRFGEARPVLAMLLRKAPSPRAHALLARCAEALGDPAAAARHWREAEGPEATVGLGRALQALGDGAAAEAKLREAAAGSLPPGAETDVWRRIAHLCRARGDEAGAEEALLRALPFAAEDRGRILEEIGDLRGGRGDPAGALHAYEEALVLRPRHGVLHHKVLEIHTVHQNWRQALEVLDRLIEKETDLAVRGEYLYAAGRIAEEDLLDQAGALPYHLRAAEDGHEKALPAVERLAEARGDWKNLARAYRHELRRRPRDGALWRKLADLLWNVGHERDAAVAAYEAAAALEPDSIERHDRLARLYLEAGSGWADKAIAELQAILRARPERDDIYPQLSRLYADAGLRDEAYCLAEVLVLLGQAGEEERRRAEALRPTALPHAAAPLTDERWGELQHPREDRALGGAFAVLAAALAASVAEPRAALKLKQPDDVPLLGYVAATLGVTPPEIHVRPGLVAAQVAHLSERGRVVAALLVPPLGEEPAAAFLLAKKLALFRPERYAIAALGSVPRLEAALAAGRIACGLAPATPDKLAAQIQKLLPAAARDHAAALLERADGNVLAWVSAADLTANRVGLVVSAHLPAAARAVATEKSPLTSLSAKQRLLDLVAFAASEEYFAVRRHLDIGVKS